MSDIEKKLQLSLFKISELITKTHSTKSLYCLQADALSIIEIANLMELKIKIPPIIKNFSTYYNNSRMNDLYEYIWYEGIRLLLETTPETDEKICEIGDKLYNKYNISYTKGKTPLFTVSKAIKMAEQFFDYFDKELLKHYKYMLDNNFVIFSDRGTLDYKDAEVALAINASIFSQRQSFIGVAGLHDITFIASIIHEIIHSYINSLLYDITFEQRNKIAYNCLDEVYTYFSEHAFANYLKEIKYNRDVVSFLESDTCNRLIRDLHFYSDSPNKNYNINKYTTVKASAYGKLLAFYYFDEYLKDPEKTKDNLLNLSLASKDYDRDFILNSFGMTEERVTNFCKIEKRLSKNYGY